MLRANIIGPIALALGGVTVVWPVSGPAQELPPLPPPDAATTEINQLEQESARLSQEARELGGGDTIAQSASNVRTSFYGHKALADELEQFAEDMGYTEAELRAELWLMTRQQAGSLGDSADSIRQNWRLLNELLLTKYLEMGREAAKMRRLDEIQQRYRAINDRIATLQQGGGTPPRATTHAGTTRERDSGYDQLLEQIDLLKFERKIAQLQGNGAKVRQLDREIAPLERRAEQAERIPALNRTSSSLLNYHNALRFAEGSPPLKWSQTLANDAGKWAQVMASTGVLQHAPRSSRPANQRENISLSPRGTNSPMTMAKVWGGEKKLFRPGVYPNVCAGEWSTCSHYTQMVWSTTTEVGCAFAQGAKFDALVCRYSPPGNQDNRPVLGPTLATAARQPCPVVPATAVRTRV